MRATMHYAGLGLTTVGAGVGIVTANTSIAQTVAPGCAVAILVGVVLALATHKPGEHGPRQGW